MSTLSSLREEVQRGQNVRDQYYTKRNYLKVEQGFNDFRVFPPHHKGGSFIRLKHVHQLDVESTDKDGKAEVRPRKVFNSRTHGGTPKDIVDEYVKFVEDAVKEKLSVSGLSPKERDEKEKQWLNPVRDWKTGLKPQFNFVLYAVKIAYSQSEGREISAERGIVDFAFSLGGKIEALCASYDRRGSVATVDPLSDPQNGGILVVDYDKSRKNAEKYIPTIDLQNKRPLTQDDLKWHSEQDSLDSMFVLSYRRKDFNMALDGLKRFDQKHGYNVFKSDRWLSIVEEISAYYPQDEETPMRDMNVTKSESPLDYKASNNINVNDAQEVVPEQPSPEVKERGMLLDIIESEKLPITVHPEHSNDQIKAFIEQERKLKTLSSPPSSVQTGQSDIPQTGFPNDLPGDDDDINSKVDSLF